MWNMPACPVPTCPYISECVFGAYALCTHAVYILHVNNSHAGAFTAPKNPTHFSAAFSVSLCSSFNYYDYVEYLEYAAPVWF